MTYLFTGVFTNDPLDVPAINGNKFILKDLFAASNQQLRYGIYFPELALIDNEYKTAAALSYFKELHQYGLKKALYLNYLYWGGMLEQIDSFVIENDTVIQETKVSVCDQPERKMNDKFVSIMRSFNVDIDSSGYFKPFEKGFWGVDGM